MPIPGPDEPAEELRGPWAILGPGAIGGLLAAALWRTGADVVCVASARGAPALARHGIRLESAGLGSFVARPKIVERLLEPPAVLVVATKAPQLGEAVTAVDPAIAGDALVLPLLNGCEHLERLRRRYRRVAAASIGHVEAYRRSPYEIVHRSPSARIEMAADDAGTAARLAAVARGLSAAGFHAEVVESEAVAVWGKLVRLCPMACITAASGRALGAARGDPAWRPRLEEAVREVVRVAAAAGYAVAPEVVLAQIDALPAELRTSLQRDVEAGREGELDALAGAVVRAGASHGIRCPALDALARDVASRVAVAGRAQ